MEDIEIARSIKMKKITDITEKLNIPEELKKDGIKEIYSVIQNLYFVSNSGDLYICGETHKSDTDSRSGIGRYEKITKLDLKDSSNHKIEVDTFYNIDNNHQYYADYHQCVL